MSFMGVVANQLPGAVATVSLSAWPVSTEVDVPFRIDPTTGQVAVLKDPVRRATEHILSLMFTAPGERVMRPGYGVGANQMVFADASASVYALVASQLQQTASGNTSGYSIVGVNVINTAPNVLAFEVNFTVDGTQVVHQAVFDFTGDLVGYS